MLRNDPENCALPFSLIPAEAANKLHADFGESIDVERRSIGRAGKLQRRNPSCPRNIVDLVVALVEHTGGIHPPLQVLASINAWRSNVLTHRQSDRAARAVYFIGDLSTARRCTDDQDATVGKLIGISVFLGGQLHH